MQDQRKLSLKIENVYQRFLKKQKLPAGSNEFLIVFTFNKSFRFSAQGWIFFGHLMAF